MIKSILFGLPISIFLFGSIGNPFLNLTLPEGMSNMYADSLAVHWTISDATSVGHRDQLEVEVELTNSFDDLIFKSTSDTDSIINLPAVNDQRAILRICVSKADFSCTYDHVISKIDTHPEIEVLRDNVKKNASINSYTLLARAYEGQRCYVNAIFVLNKIKKIDQKTGDELWQAFMTRHFYEFNNRVKR